MALCRELLKTFGPNDVLLLASLLAMGDESLEGYYGSETKSDLPPSAPDAKGDIADGATFQLIIIFSCQWSPRRRSDLRFQCPRIWQGRLRNSSRGF